MRYRYPGKLVRKRIGALTAANAYIESLREARQSGGGTIPLSARGSFKTSAQLAVEATAAEAAKVAAAQNGVLVGELCDGLLKELMETPEADHRTPPRRIARIKRELGQRVATSIQPQEIKKWLNSLRSESIYPKREESVFAPKVNPATANRLRTQLSAIYEFGRTEGLLPRAFLNPVRDVKVKKIGIQPTGGGRTAISGDFVMVAREVNPVLRALRTHGIEVEAMHNHMLFDEPHLYFMHFWANADAVTLAHGLRAAVDATNSKKPEAK